MKTALPILLLLSLGLAAGLGACAAHRGPSRLLDRTPAQNPVSIPGDFDDVDAVVAGMLPKFKLVEFELPSPSRDIRRFELRGLDDSRGSLTFERLAGGMIRIECRVGRFGDPDREHRLLRALAHRFKQLRGDVAVPISDP